MLDPIIKTIEVPCSQEKAFRVFVKEMDTWWPLGKFTVSAMGGKAAKAKWQRCCKAAMARAGVLFSSRRTKGLAAADLCPAPATAPA